MKEQLLYKLRYGRLYRLLESLSMLTSVFQRYPLQDMLEEQSPVFIIGSGRSGNTLLRSMLVSHGDFAIPPESYVLPNIIHEFYRYNFLPWPLLVKLVLSTYQFHPQISSTWSLDFSPLYQQAMELQPNRQNLANLLSLIYSRYINEKQPSAVRWGDKTPWNTLHLDKLQLVFPNAQYIHIIRDGRDVVASYLRMNRYEDVDEAARRWRKSIEMAQQMGSRLDSRHYIEVRYDLLVREPDIILSTLTQFLEVEYRPCMLEFWRQTDQLGDAHLTHYQNIKSPVNTNSIGKWRTELSAVQQTRVHHLLESTLVRLGYYPEL